jgi:hypothetical protein
VRWVPLWVVLGLLSVAGAAAAWRATRLAFAPLHRHALPGFDVEVPDGDIDGDDRTYAKGRFDVSRLAGVRSSLGIGWEAGASLVSDSDIASFNEGMETTFRQQGRSIPISPEISIQGPHRTRSWAARFGATAIWTTQIMCGARQVLLMTASADWGVQRAHRRVVASFRCHPDAVKEQIVAGVPAFFDVGAGWFHRRSSVDGAVEITDGRFVLVARRADRLGPDKMKRRLEAKFPRFRLGDRDGDDWPFHTEDLDEPVQGWLSLRPCVDGGQLLVMSIVGADEEDQAKHVKNGQDAKQARALLARARCRKSSEAAQTWPEEPAEDGAKYEILAK